MINDHPRRRTPTPDRRSGIAGGADAQTERGNRAAASRRTRAADLGGQHAGPTQPDAVGTAGAGRVRWLQDVEGRFLRMGARPAAPAPQPQPTSRDDLDACFDDLRSDRRSNRSPGGPGQGSNWPTPCTTTTAGSRQSHRHPRRTTRPVPGPRESIGTMTTICPTRWEWVPAETVSTHTQCVGKGVGHLGAPSAFDIVGGVSAHPADQPVDERTFGVDAATVSTPRSGKGWCATTSPVPTGDGGSTTSGSRPRTPGACDRFPIISADQPNRVPALRQPWWIGLLKLADYRSSVAASVTATSLNTGFRCPG